MSKDTTYKKIKMATPLENKELQQTEKEYGFSYRQGVGKLIYAMVTCIPDISILLIKLRQYSAQTVKNTLS